ncbi:MAG: hypothetical protein P4M13_04475 [Alphaproteobacteria bacterium]|nr:hypothetical protein [Alphaproteobacteria bacterium]
MSNAADIVADVDHTDLMFPRKNGNRRLVGKTRNNLHYELEFENPTNAQKLKNDPRTPQNNNKRPFRSGLRTVGIKDIAFIRSMPGYQRNENSSKKHAPFSQRQSLKGMRAEQASTQPTKGLRKIEDVSVNEFLPQEIIEVAKVFDSAGRLRNEAHNGYVPPSVLPAIENQLKTLESGAVDDSDKPKPQEGRRRRRPSSLDQVSNYLMALVA